MRQATVFPRGMGFVMYGGGTATHFDSLSGLRAFVEANNVNARFADYDAHEAATLAIAVTQVTADYNLYFSARDVDPYSNNDRNFGFSVRPVKELPSHN